MSDSRLPYGSYGSLHRRRGSHFRLFSDELPQITFDSTLETNKPHFKDARKQDRLDSGYYPLPLTDRLPITDRTDPSRSKLPEMPRARSESVKVFPILRKLSKEHRKVEQFAKSDGLLHGTRNTEKTYQYKPGGDNIPSRPSGEPRRKDMLENNYTYSDSKKNGSDDKFLRKRGQPVILDTSKLLKVPATDNVSLTWDPFRLRSPKRTRSNKEQVTLLVHDSNGSPQDNASVTVTLGRSDYHRRKNAPTNSVGETDDFRKQLLKKNTFSAVKTKVRNIGGRGEGGGGGEERELGDFVDGEDDSASETTDSFLSRLNQALKGYDRQGTPTEIKGKGGLLTKSQRHQGSNILPPITERQATFEELIKLEDSSERGLLCRSGSSAKTPGKRESTVAWKKGSGKAPAAEKLEKIEKPSGRRHRRRIRSKEVTPNSSSRNSGVATDTDDNSTYDARDRNIEDGDDVIDRSMTGIELIKAYRIWDRKRRRFPNGLRSIVLPEYQKDENDAFLKVLASAKLSFEHLRKRRSDETGSPISRLTPSVVANMRSY